VVTRYWFCAMDAAGTEPAALLPRAPDSIATFKAEWNWSDIDRPAFLRLRQNHGAWSERHSGPVTPRRRCGRCSRSIGSSSAGS